MQRIIHLDMDAFYASVEERDNPKLAGKPVIVGSPPGSRGVVSTCNYIARKYGVRSAMSSAEAYRRCPNGIFVPPDFSKYIKASNIVHSIMAEYTDELEFVALDEGYMDVTGSQLLFGKAEDIAKEIQSRVKQAVGVTCSVGVGYSMMSAKCASEEKKPNGFFVINSPEDFFNLMKDRDVGQLYGIGAKTAEKLKNMGIRTVEQLANASDMRLSVFKNSAKEMKLHAMGIDNRKIVSNAEAKSIGREITFMEDKDTENDEQRKILYDTLLLLSEDVGFRLYKIGKWCRTVTLKIKFFDMKSITRSTSGFCIRDYNELYKKVSDLFDDYLSKASGSKKIRLIGLSTSNFTDEKIEQLSFTQNQNPEKEHLNSTVLKIKDSFGRGVLKTAKEIAAERCLEEEFKNSDINKRK